MEVGLFIYKIDFYMISIRLKIKWVNIYTILGSLMCLCTVFFKLISSLNLIKHPMKTLFNDFVIIQAGKEIESIMNESLNHYPFLNFLNTSNLNCTLPSFPVCPLI